MHPVLKRIALNGFLAAGILAVVGVAYARLAEVYLARSTPTRSVPGVPPAPPPEDPAADGLAYRIPAMMALWGFVFVAAGEGLLYLWRGNRPARPAPPHRPPFTAGGTEPAVNGGRYEAAPSPSPAPGENSPVQPTAPG